MSAGRARAARRHPSQAPRPRERGVGGRWRAGLKCGRAREAMASEVGDAHRNGVASRLDHGGAREENGADEGGRERLQALAQLARLVQREDHVLRRGAREATSGAPPRER
eukprot:2449767-Prymnesium_polylepis.1